VAVAGVVSQAAVAVVAAYLAYRANTISKESAFVEAIVAELLAIRNQAQSVSVAYHRMFDPFPTRQDKEDAYRSWLSQREAVGDRLSALAESFPEAMPVKRSWGDLDECEDSHLFSADFGRNPAKMAKAAYRRAFDRVVDTISDCMKALRRR